MNKLFAVLVLGSLILIGCEKPVSSSGKTKGPGTPVAAPDAGQEGREAGEKAGKDAAKKAEADAKKAKDDAMKGKDDGMKAKPADADKGKTPDKAAPDKK